MQIGRVVKLLIQSIKDFAHDNCSQWAAAIAYYSMLSIFPLLLAATAIAAYFVDPQWAIQQGSQLLGKFLPGSVTFVQQIIQNIIQTRGQVSVVSILLLIWSGSRVFGVITKALNIAYDVNEPYGFLKRTLMELLMTVTLGILFLVALGSRTVLSLIDGLVPIPALHQGAAYQLLAYLFPAVLILVSLYLIYRYVPRRKVTKSAAFAGAALFTLLFLIAQPLFTSYINTFAHYNLVYGPLAIVVTLIFWIWISANFLLLGGEFASHIQDMLVEQKSDKEVDEHHQQRNPTHPVRENA